MKPDCNSHKSQEPLEPRQARRLQALPTITLMLLLLSLVPLSAALAQSHDSHGSGRLHSFPAEAIEVPPSTSVLWTRIHSSHLGLLHVVPAMSKSDVKVFSKALRDDLKELAENSDELSRQSRESLADARDRVNELTKSLVSAVEARDSAAANEQLGQLDEQLERISRLFPAGALTQAEGLSLPPQTSVTPISGLELISGQTIGTEELKLSPVPPRKPTSPSDPNSGKSNATDKRVDESCLTHSEAAGGDCACCRKAIDGTNE